MTQSPKYQPTTTMLDTSKFTAEQRLTWRKAKKRIRNGYHLLLSADSPFCTRDGYEQVSQIFSELFSKLENIK